MSETAPARTLSLEALRLAALEIGTAEVPPGSNRGPRVEVYQRGYDGAEYLVGQRWCARFARWCFETAAKNLGVPSPFAGWKSDLASALKWREQSRLRRCWTSTPAPGRVALHLTDSGAGHVTIVESVEQGMVVSVGGNEADAVRRIKRPVAYYSGGFVEVG